MSLPLGTTGGNAVQCDECHLFDRTENALMWLVVERAEVQPAGEPDSWFFCSWLCLSMYATTRGSAEN